MDTLSDSGMGTGACQTPVSPYDQAVQATEKLFNQARECLKARVSVDGRIKDELFDPEQYACHAFAWLKIYLESLVQMENWHQRLLDQEKSGECEKLILDIAFSEYLSRIAGGIPMSQLELARLTDLYLDQDQILAFTSDSAVSTFIQDPGLISKKMRLAELLGEGQTGHLGYTDETLELVQDQFSRFATERIKPYAHQWHLNDELIPMELYAELAELGVFGLTMPEEFGGLGMSKEAMCIVTEELSRGYIGVGSLPTRSEIAGELISLGGTQEQKNRYLPAIASGEIVPTAVFTEPDIGSDLASLKTRAVVEEDGQWHLYGAKNWITHAARANLMTVLARSEKDIEGYRGLSMFLAEKTPGSDSEPFPDSGIEGSEIGVLGYRGMKEYALAFDGFIVGEGQLLGHKPGEGFKQLMATFESARIQTAARAVGVAASAMDHALTYAKERRQFGKPIIAFQRVAIKIAQMAVETMIARQLTLFAARQKDDGERCDLEAGLAKLLAAQIAFSASDNALQIHGGNGYAQEYEISRVFCDSRILNIFEGAAEIQAQVIAKRLLSA